MDNILASLLITLTILTFTMSMPQNMYPQISFRMEIYQQPIQSENEPKARMLTGGLSSLEREYNNRSVSLSSRSIGEKLSRRSYSKRTRHPSNVTQSSAAQIQRLENGTLKILYGNKPTRESDESDIIFPDDPQRLYKKPSLTLGHTNPCGGSLTFCENNEKYPVNYLEGVLDNSASNYNDILGVDEIDSGPIEIGQRNDFTTTETLCKSVEKIIYPKVAMNKENKWLFVINQPKYEQGVRIEMCESDSSPCQFAERFPNGFVATCKQKYIYRKMLALNDDGQTVPDLFRLPSCCSCTIKSPGDIGSRLGYDIASTSDAFTKKSNKRS